MERFGRTVKAPCMESMIFFGEASLRKAIHEFVTHYHYSARVAGKIMRRSTDWRKPSTGARRRRFHAVRSRHASPRNVVEP